ncbi:hypothetical protein LCGC14_2556650 [marine sediment metagenome]|uniref:Uncharacterized protein n=1 Tax=marine sediment metagenome TaxID=412755 RepID=A0A0F9CXJ7_9ZZZZ
MNSSDGKSCGGKHLRLAGTIVLIVLAVCGGTITYAMATASAQDARLRTVEQDNAANTARFEAIQQSLERIERRIDP